ncbi:ATP-binding protein [Mycoplana ramosa]|uniref:ATP-binding protein n=1 Tax=Mycoplana ramosa TaxID=40837 RepID=A0ABW3YY27_MYCRA
MTTSRPLALVNDLLALPGEQSWLEFKGNNTNPQMIGERISALSNAARLADKNHAYMLWGVQDGDHAVIGTGFQPSSERVQSQPLEFWLSQRLSPDVAFSFHEIVHPDGRVLLLEIPAATVAPVEFDRTAYIRIGSATPRLSDYPDRMRALWAKLQPYVWETGIAAQYVTSDEVLARLDYTSFFELTQQPLPDNRNGIFDRLQAEKLVIADVGGRWNITNLGAILFAKNLDEFDTRLSRKGVRFVAYDGNNRAANVVRRQDGKRGYASGFKGLIEYISALLPENEHIGQAFRTETVVFPPIAIRELIANALIHQDMTIQGTGPLIELFKDRMEITNPGEPLVSPDRFIDAPPRSRNEAMAALMRRMRICEEQGTGIDKVVAAAELYQLPPPDFQADNNATRAVLLAPRRFADMTTDERIRACQQHAVLKFVSGEVMRNSTLRERFGIEPQNAAQVSQVIRAALDRNLIRPADPERPKAGYVPVWA